LIGRPPSSFRNVRSTAFRRNASVTKPIPPEGGTTNKERLDEQTPLSFWQIWNMSFGFMGIQFGWGLQLANMSGIYA
jgi:hypothetical protein